MSRAQDIIKKHNSSQPLFLYMAFQNVHDPIQVRKPFALRVSMRGSTSNQTTRPTTYNLRNKTNSYEKEPKDITFQIKII